MRSVLRGFVAAVLLLAVSLPASGATASEFYLAMLRRGVTAYDAGRFDAAVGPLKTAAFGLVDSIEHYQTAQIHLALANDRLGNAEASREAARRVVVAQRVETRYASLPLSQATRSSFDSLANRLLTPADLAVLTRGGAAPPTPAVTAPSIPKTQDPQPAPVPAQRSQPATETAVAPPKRDPPPAEHKPEPPAPKPQPQPPVVKTEPPAPKPQPPAAVRPAVNVPSRFAAAEHALNSMQLVEARRIYRELLETPSLQRNDLLRVAEGLYRSRDFANVLRAFERVGALRRGEEPYRYYVAVALYETAQYAKAKEELAAVLPFIEVTPDVARYRAKIEGAVN